MANFEAVHLPKIWMNVTTSAGWNRPPVGIVRVEIELCRELKTLYGERFSTCVFKDGKFIAEGDDNVDQFWPDVLEDFPEFKSIDGVPNKTIANEVLLEKEVASQKIQKDRIFCFGDVLITVGLDWELDQSVFTGYLADLKNKYGVHVVACCYDLIPVLFPHFCVGNVAAYFKTYFSGLTWASSLMLCISKKTQSDYLDLIEGLGLPQVPTAVFPLGSKLSEKKLSVLVSAQVEEIIKGPYILFVSTIERRKNHEVLYRAYNLLCRAGYRNVLPKLVFVGMPGWGVGDLLRDIELDPKTKGLITQLNHVTDFELELLYEKCMFFVYPSLYEGWGLPVAEALAHGRPVLASPCGSIPEVGGDLVDYIDPWVPSAWADAIIEAVKNPDRVEEKSKEIKAEYKPYTWKMAAETVKLAIDGLIKNKSVFYQFEPGYDLSSFCGIPYAGKLIASGKEGVLSFGPYVSLPSGGFSVGFSFSLQSGGVGDFIVRAACDKGERVLAEDRIQISADMQGEFNIELEFSLDDFVDDFEVVSMVHEGIKLVFNRVEVRQRVSSL